MVERGQTSCAYCKMSLVDSYEHWLLLTVDHVIPDSGKRRKGGHRLGTPKAWHESYSNIVVSCSGCNGFRHRYAVSRQEPTPECTEAMTLRQRNGRWGARRVDGPGTISGSWDRRLSPAVAGRPRDHLRTLRTARWRGEDAARTTHGPGWREFARTVGQLRTGRQAGSGIASSRAGARRPAPSHGQPLGRCRVSGVPSGRGVWPWK